MEKSICEVNIYQIFIESYLFFYEFPQLCPRYYTCVSWVPEKLSQEIRWQWRWPLYIFRHYHISWLQRSFFSLSLHHALCTWCCMYVLKLQDSFSHRLRESINLLILVSLNQKNWNTILQLPEQTGKISKFDHFAKKNRVNFLFLLA